MPDPTRPPSPEACGAPYEPVRAVDQPLRAVVAEDAPLMRAAIVMILRSAGIEVAAEAEDGESLIAAVDEHRPGVCVVDVRMPPLRRTEGLDAAEAIKAAHPQVGVVLLSQHVDVQTAQRVFAAGFPGGVGYLLKERAGSVETFVAAVRSVAAGGCVTDPEVVAVMVQGRARADPLAALTPRERQVLALIAEGWSNGAIATRLGMGRRTVESHVGQIFDQLGIEATDDSNRRVRAVLTYLRS